MYKLIAMDMDGTLLTNDKDITERSKRAIKRAKEKGVIPVVCTGRIFASAKVLAKLIETSAPVVASNGAYIRENNSEDVIYKKALEKGDIKSLVNDIKEAGFYPHLFTHDTVYSEKLIYSSRNYDLWNKFIPENERVKIEIVEDLSLVPEKEDNILKVVSASEDVSGINELKEFIKTKYDLEVVSAIQGNFEVMAKGVSKGNAIKALCEMYDINEDEVICIGDSENDESMLEVAGLSVAMGNAEEYLKTIANYITDTNEEDGVAKVIEKFILES